MQTYQMELDELYFDFNAIEPYKILQHALENGISWYGLLYPAKNSIILTNNQSRKRKRESPLPYTTSKRQRIL